MVDSYSLNDGDVVHVYTSNFAGDAVYVNVITGSITYGPEKDFARFGPTVTTDDRGDVTATHAGEELWLHGEENGTEVEVQRQGWSLSLFSREIINIRTQSGTNIDTVDVTNYPELNGVVSSTYPITVDETWTIKELIMFDAPSDKTLDITTESGTTVNGIEPKARSFVLDKIQIDSFDINDPQGSGGETSAIWSGE